MAAEKTCWTCQLTKPLEEFCTNKHKLDGKSIYCVPCRKEYNKQYYVLNKTRLSKRVRNRNTTLLRVYGISLDEYENLLERQGEVCAICQTKCSVKENMPVDHNHKTKEIRGILCNGCNIGLGSFKDSPERLRKAAEYLEREIYEY